MIFCENIFFLKNNDFSHIALKFRAFCKKKERKFFILLGVGKLGLITIKGGEIRII